MRPDNTIAIYVCVVLSLFIIVLPVSSIYQANARLDRCIRAHAAGISLKECEQIERKP